MRIKKFDKYTLLEVLWYDIVERSGWNPVDKAQLAECAKAMTIGIFLSNHKGCLNIAGTVSKDEECNVTTIPWGVIYNIRELGYVDGDNECKD